ncbi:tetratricopeptide repeat protein [Vibrio rumoiensis]|uniref:MalT-like TPR region domain-containing protein n=1 Tax=Vibrio rumoiensis 1S-45 TaxID=1188252 RepID=A0A1E5E0H5_9VIBR|nr:hypothetical protein [Vibrio rumoiensis]OEF23929.1 hypothetical protein A1QC_01910 [Vibrio rumoiensis 1S-45]
MKKTFWLCLLLVLSFSTPIQAKVYLSPILNEANKLLTVTPNQSLNITKQFLSSRKLVTTNSQDYTLSRDGSEQTIRTPATTVEAMQIMAMAYHTMGSHKTALQTLKEAADFAKQYGIPNQQVSTLLLHAELLWQDTYDLTQIKPYLNDIDQQLKRQDSHSSWYQEIKYEQNMFEAEVNAHLDDTVKTEASFQQAQNYLSGLNSASLNIDYHLRLGQYYLTQKKYDDALKELLTTYWMAVKEGDSVELARTNRALATLFYSRHVFDKALEHATEAADFYDNYPYSIPLSDTINLMADTYFKQGKYNLALVNYLNLLDNETNQRSIKTIIQLRVNIANTYLKLFDFVHAENYLSQAETMVEHTSFTRLKAEVSLLKAALALPDNNSDLALIESSSALKLALALHDKSLQMHAYQIQSSAYQQKNDFKQALKAEKQYQQLSINQQEQFNAVNEEVFRQQKDIIEKSLHYAGLEDNLTNLNKEYLRYQRATIILMVIAFILIFVVLRRGYLNQKIREELEVQTIDLYTHPRSGLQNLKLLNTKLPKSLEQSSAVFEQWRLGELINEPLSDRLHFVMIDLTFLRNLYLKRGYLAGLEIEKKFGLHVNQFITEPARLYHFSDGLFLYIEPKTEQHQTPEDFFNKIQSWITSFEAEMDIDRQIKIGIAEYPFLPRAYTAINDKELIDILLMAIYLARKISDRHPETPSQWVRLSAIENAPAASFASDNIRLACQQAVEQGLIKVQTSDFHEDLAKDILRNEGHRI